MASWLATVLLIKDHKRTITFYEKNFGFQLVDHIQQESKGFWFMGIFSEEHKKHVNFQPGTKEAHEWLTNLSIPKPVLLCFQQNSGSENDENFKINTGNVEPYRGFGHIAVSCNDVYQSCEELEKNNVAFQKKPDEGRMKGLAFALDPDGYWIEVIKRSEGHTISNPYNLSQTMIRIKDPKPSLQFYRDTLGLTVVRERHFEEAKFSLFFMQYISEEEKKALPDPSSQEANDALMRRFQPVIELTHNHGTESDSNFKYHTGATQPLGFLRLAFVHKNPSEFQKELEKNNKESTIQASSGSSSGLSQDPDGYHIEIFEAGVAPNF